MWPVVRKSVKGHMATLFDFEFQKGWADTNYKHAFWDSLNYYIFDYLFDGAGDLYDGDGQAIGVCLYNKEEERAINDFLDFSKDAFEGKMPDDYYVNHPQWSELLQKAKDIVKMMEENEERFNFKDDLEDYYLELRRERETEVSECVDQTESFSAEEKHSYHSIVIDLYL